MRLCPDDLFLQVEYLDGFVDYTLLIFLKDALGDRLSRLAIDDAR